MNAILYINRTGAPWCKVIGWQNPESEHGHITYFTPLGPGVRRGEGAFEGRLWPCP